MSSLARTLLLATKLSPSIEEATKDLRGKSSSLLVCAALSMVERMDLEVVVYYEKFRESLAVGDDLASPLYVILRDLKGPEIRSLRTKLRLKQGCSVLFNYGQDSMFTVAEFGGCFFTCLEKYDEIGFGFGHIGVWFSAW
jgi:hypothetical protein